MNKDEEEHQVSGRHKDDNPTTLGKYLTEARRQRGLSINELGRLSGMPGSTIMRIERGFRLDPTPDTLRALAKGLNVPVAEVFEQAGLARPADLPAIQPYLRTKYGKELPEEARAEIAKSFADIARKYGLDPNDQSGDDEV